MSFTELDLYEMPWNLVRDITFLKHEVIIIFRSGTRLCAKPPDNKTYLQFYEEAKKRLKEDQIELGDVEGSSLNA